jgi:hypothetical protein
MDQPVMTKGELLHEEDCFFDGNGVTQLIKDRYHACTDR